MSEHEEQMALGREDFLQRRQRAPRPSDEDADSAAAYRWYGYMLERAAVLLRIKDMMKDWDQQISEAAFTVMAVRLDAELGLVRPTDDE